MTSHKRYNSVIEFRAGQLDIKLKGDGILASLTDARTGVECMHRLVPSSLLSVELYGGRKIMPVSVEAVPSVDCEGSCLRFGFDEGISVDVCLAEKPHYARLSITAVRCRAGGEGVASVCWGPLNTGLKGPPGEIVGIVRGGGFSLGMMGLDPNTDAGADLNFQAASFLADGSGSVLRVSAEDHTRDGSTPKGLRIKAEPGCSVVGSSVAVFGCGTDRELDVIEVVELEERLPHPSVDGVWLKRSREVLRPSTWMFFDEKSVDDAIGIAGRMGALSLSSFHDMFGNWGHFDVDAGLWPSGIGGIRAAAERAKKAGVRLVMYTLTTFIKPHPVREPYLAPVPDPRLQTLGPSSELAVSCDPSGDALVLDERPGLFETLQIQCSFGSWIEDFEENRVVKVDNEIIYYRDVRRDGSLIYLEGCRRGLFHTAAAGHEAGAGIVRLLLGEFRNFYPGTLDMQAEVADRIAERALAGGFGQITFDGHESCLETGHGIYARNMLTKRIYDRCGAEIPVYTGSNLGNYDWHVLSFIRWGEFELEKGFRGTMLDYRLMRQVQLARNLMPHGLGQYYPSEAALEDIEWVMALAAGWDSAVDFTIFPDVFAENPERDSMLDAIGRWNRAQREGFFSQEQKMRLRQPDCLHSLSAGDIGEWNLSFRGRWVHDGLEILEPSCFNIVPVSGCASVEPLSIDWNWTHNPGVYAKAGLSDDLAGVAGCGECAWTVTWPEADREDSDSLQFVLRLDRDAAGPVSNPCMTLDGVRVISIPVTIKPGQYLSLCFDMAMAFLYGENHEVAAEAHVIGCLTKLPRVPRRKPCRLGLSLESEHKSICLLNICTRESIKPAKGQKSLTERVLTDMNICIRGA